MNFQEKMAAAKWYVLNQVQEAWFGKAPSQRKELEINSGLMIPAHVEIWRSNLIEGCEQGIMNLIDGAFHQLKEEGAWSVYEEHYDNLTDGRDVLYRVSVVESRFYELQEKYDPKDATSNDDAVETVQCAESSISQCERQFHFKNGILFRDHCGEVMTFKNENSLQYKLLRCAFSLPIGEQLDGATDDLDMSGRQIPDTARHLNEEIEKVFGISLFVHDYPNKWAKRIVE